MKGDGNMPAKKSPAGKSTRKPKAGAKKTTKK